MLVVLKLHVTRAFNDYARKYGFLKEAIKTFLEKILEKESQL